jgi:hypothetical protein
MVESNIPTREPKEKFTDKLEREFDNRTKERQVKFLEETIRKLEAFKQQVVNGEAFIDNATMNCEQTAANKEEIGGHNIYINIDYQVVEQNIK